MRLGEAHRQALEQFRSTMNLVGPGPIEVHFTDCERALEGLEPRGEWADLGSGAGFPGLVLAELHPELSLILVESRRKRCWFLEHVLTLNPNHYEAIYGLGLIFEIVGEPEKAYDAYSRALAIHPHHEEVTNAVNRLKPQVEGAAL